jgi:hypothetical protein
MSGYISCVVLGNKEWPGRNGGRKTTSWCFVVVLWSINPCSNLQHSAMICRELCCRLEWQGDETCYSAALYASMSGRAHGRSIRGLTAWHHCMASHTWHFNPLNPELNPICYLLALLAHQFSHVSRIRVKLLTIRLLMSYIYGASILDVSRSHTTTHHSR